MKSAALILFSLFITIHSYCQNNSEKLLYVRKSETYRKVKNTGVTLTVLGTISLIVGNVVSNNKPDYTGPGKAPSGLHDEGLIWKAGGIVCLGSGVPLWIVGAVNQKKYENKLENLFVRFNINPKGGGLSLTYCF